MKLRLKCGLVDLGRLEVHRREPVPLTPIEAELLRVLAEAEGEVVTREQLLREAWDWRAPTHSTRAVDNVVMRLRPKIEVDPKQPDHLLAVRGVGYRLDLPAAQADPSFLGRGEELASLRRRVAEAPSLITVHGPGGAGKTRLAREALPEWPVVEASLFRDLDELAISVVSALGRRVGQRDPQELAGALLREGARLVLDEVEGLVDALRAALPAWMGPRTRLVLTSRVALGLPEEQVLSLGGLPEAEALTLLGGDSPEHRRLAQQLDRLPLALELASAWLELVQPAWLSEHLAEGLARRGGGGKPGHESMAVVIDGSLDALAPDQVQALGRLAAFPAPFPAEDAAAALEGLAQPLRLIDALLGRSLLRLEGQLLRMPSLVRARVIERFDRRDEAWPRLTEAMLPQVEAWSVAWHARSHDAGQPLLARLPLLRVLVDNEPDPVKATMLQRGAFPALQDQAVAQQELPRLDALLARLPESEVAHRAWLLRQRCTWLERAGDASAAAACFGDAAALLAPTSPDWASSWWSIQASDLVFDGQREQAARAIARARAHAAASWAVAFVSLGEANLLCAHGQPQQAMLALERGADEAEAAGDLRSAELLERSRARIAYYAWELDVTRSFYALDLARARDRGDRRREGMALLYLGLAAHGAGGLDEADGLLHQALDIARRIGDSVVEASTWEGLALVAIDQGQPERALQHAQALFLATPRPLSSHRPRLLARMACLRAVHGDRARALRAVERAHAELAGLTPDAPLGDFALLEAALRGELRWTAPMRRPDTWMVRDAELSLRLARLLQ